VKTTVRRRLAFVFRRIPFAGVNSFKFHELWSIWALHSFHAIVDPFDSDMSRSRIMTQLNSESRTSRPYLGHGSLPNGFRCLILSLNLSSRHFFCFSLQNDFHMCTASKFEPNCQNCHACSLPILSLTLRYCETHSHLWSNSPPSHVRKTISMNES
jgi:hypothetical protein